MPTLLALDLSSDVGWAILRGGPPRFGTLKLGDGDMARRLWRLGQFLEDLHALERFDAVAWERPLLMRTDTVHKLELLYGAVGVCYAFAGKYRLPWREVTVQEVKLAVTDDPRADKVQMVAAANNDFDWGVSSHHEADAGGVGLVAWAALGWP